MFYWAILDTSGLPAPGIRPSTRVQRLGYLFESILPEPTESVHAVYLPIAAGHVLACALPRDRLSDRHEDAISLGPLEAPPFILESLANEHRALDASGFIRSINLLTGEYEPPAVLRAKSRCSLHVVMILTLCTLLITIGLERRTQSSRSSVMDMNSHIQTLYDLALGDATSNGQDPAARLLSELRRMRAASDSRNQLQTPPDVSIALASILERWPSVVAAQTSNVHLTGDRVMITALLPNTTQAEQLERSMSEVDGWTIGQRTFRPARDGVELRLPLVPIEEGTP